MSSLNFSKGKNGTEKGHDLKIKTEDGKRKPIHVLFWKEYIGGGLSPACILQIHFMAETAI